MHLFVVLCFWMSNILSCLLEMFKVNRAVGISEMTVVSFESDMLSFESGMLSFESDMLSFIVCMLNF